MHKWSKTAPTKSGYYWAVQTVYKHIQKYMRKREKKWEVEFDEYELTRPLQSFSEVVYLHTDKKAYTMVFAYEPKSKKKFSFDTLKPELRAQKPSEFCLWSQQITEPKEKKESHKRLRRYRRIPARSKK